MIERQQRADDWWQTLRSRRRHRVAPQGSYCGQAVVADGWLARLIVSSQRSLSKQPRYNHPRHLNQRSGRTVLRTISAKPNW
jgi:hypothetical protein